MRDPKTGNSSGGLVPAVALRVMEIRPAVMKLSTTKSLRYVLHIKTDSEYMQNLTVDPNEYNLMGVAVGDQITFCKAGAEYRLNVIKSEPKTPTQDE